MPIILNLKRYLLSNIFIGFSFIFLFNNTIAFGQENIKKKILIKIKGFEKRPDFEKDTTYLNLLLDLNREYYEYNLDSLLIISKKVIKLSEAIEYDKGAAHGYLDLGIYYSDIGEQDEAISNYSKARLKGEELKDTLIIIKSISDLAKEYEFKENHANALKEYLNGIEIAKKSNNNSWLGSFYLNISVLYGKQKEHETSIFFLKKALELYRNIKSEKATGVTLCNLAFALMETGDLENATLNVNEGITILEMLNEQFWLTYAYELKAHINLKQDHFNSALVWLKKSEKIHEGIDQTRFKIPLFLLLSKAYYGLYDYELSESYAVKALNISKELNALDGRDEILEVLYKVKKATNDYESALDYLEKFKTVVDTKNKNENEQELRILKSNFKFEQEIDVFISL